MDLTIHSGSMARLECAAKGHPAPQISWEKDGGTDFPAARERRMHDPRILCLHLYRQGGCSRSDPLQPRGSVTQRDIFVTSTPRSQCPGEPDIISRQRAVFFPSHHERVALSIARKQKSWRTGVIAPVNWCELEPKIVPYLS
ncbi:leucine-rich repeats and immunoglobulin-like domains protein 1 isoform X3 [Castor canadensis]